MAEENREQNAVQPQTEPQQPADQTQTSVTEPIDVQQPTVTIPAAETSAAKKADDTPDYASAAGESTVVGSAPTAQYRPAPEYGAYGPTPTQQTQEQPTQQQSYDMPNNGAQQPQQNRNPFFGNPYANGTNGTQNANQGNVRPNNGNPFLRPQGGANVPPNGSGTPNNGNPFGNPFGNANHDQQGQSNAKGGVKSNAATHVVTAVVAALVSAGLCLGIGYAAITNGWVRVPTSNSLSSISSNSSGSGSATAKSGESADWVSVAKDVSDSVVAIQVATSEGTAKGSGAIVSDKGYIVTNNHVISGAQQIQVTLANGTIYSAQIVGTDTTTDLAVIKLDNPPSDLTAVEFADSDSLAVGESVMAIGNPLGYDDTATTGIISALNRPVTVTDDDNNAIVTNAVQIDAAINPGNSGGPTFNAAGQVIGINSSIASTASSSSTAGSIGIGFAIPSNLVKRVANEIIENGSVQHVALGITIISSSVEADGVTRGCTQVQSVVDGGPASKAGLKAGDSIVAFDGKAVNNNYSLLGYVRASAMNDTVTLTIVRDGNTMDVEVTLDQEESTSSSSSNSQGQNNQNNQNNNGQNGQDDSNNGYGFSDPFGQW